MSVFHWRSTRLFGTVVLLIVLMGFIGGGQTPRALAAGSSTITLSTSQTTQSVGAPVSLTATILDGNGQPMPNVQMTFNVVSGPDAGKLVGSTTNSNGQAISSFTGTQGPGIDTIGAQFFDPNKAVNSNTVQVLWGTDPSSVTLNPSTTTQNLGAPATVTATVIGPDGKPAANQMVTFTIVSGPDAGLHIAATTDANGQAAFTFIDSSAAGTDIVQSSFTDSFGQTATSNQVQVVFVGDTTPPTLSLPSLITVDATGQSGAAVNYTVTATDPDNSPSQLTIKCSPISGSTFPIGTTTVTCTASDPAGNSATGSFSVVVQPALKASGTSVSATEGSVFSGVVATGTAYGTTGPLTASINWGDGSSSTVSVTPAPDGSYSVSASHTYAEEGQDTIHIAVSDGSGHSASTTSPASVSDAALTLKQFVAGQVKHLTAGLAAIFTDADPTGQVSDYQATIIWGDGTNSTVKVVNNPFGTGFALAGLHGYANNGTYTVTLTVTDQGGSQLTKTVTVRVK